MILYIFLFSVFFFLVIACLWLWQFFDQFEGHKRLFKKVVQWNKHVSSQPLTYDQYNFGWMLSMVVLLISAVLSCVILLDLPKI